MTRKQRSKAKSAGPRSPVRVLNLKAWPTKGICILQENGIPCPNPVQSRGLCGKHLSYLRAHNRLEEFARPKRTARDLKHTFEVKAHPEIGVCRLTVNGKPCTSRAKRRGLCVKHYQSIWQRPDLDLEEYCLPAFTERKVRLRRKIVAGACRVRENGVDCDEPAHARGLCRKHYRWLKENHPALFDEIASPDPKARRYTLRRQPREGRCRAAVNNRGCPRPAKIRGLCQHCYNVLRQKPDLLAEIALPSIEVTARRFELKADAGCAPFQCVVLENGVPCTRPPEYRGACGYHRKVIGHHRDYSLKDFYVEEAPPVLTVKAPEEAADGLCRVVEDGNPCEMPPYVRGLCRRHRRLARKGGILEELALPSEALRGRFGAGNDRPHLYLDKNVLFDHADNAFFASPGQAASVALVERVIKGQVRASVSLDAIKTTYNHVRHRLTRSVEEGGREMPEEEAEPIAREHIEKTFYRGGAWRIVLVDTPTFAKVLKADAADLSFEDALEFQAYQLARSRKAGPTMFVTRDLHFPEGVHPTHVAREFDWL